MSVYRVDSEQLALAVTSTQGSVERVRAESAGLTAGLTALEHSWDGAAAVSFQALVQQWRATQAAVEEQMVALAAALGAAGAAYDGAETDARRLFGA